MHWELVARSEPELMNHRCAHFTHSSEAAGGGSARAQEPKQRSARVGHSAYSHFSPKQIDERRSVGQCALQPCVVGIPAHQSAVGKCSSARAVGVCRPCVKRAHAHTLASSAIAMSRSSCSLCARSLSARQLSSSRCEIIRKSASLCLACSRDSCTRAHIPSVLAAALSEASPVGLRQRFRLR